MRPMQGLKAILRNGITSILMLLMSTLTHGEENMEETFAPQQITAEPAGTYAEYAMMSSNSYHKSDRVRFALEQIGWVQVSQGGQPTSMPTRQHKYSGLAYDIYEKQNTDDVAWVIRGTENTLDFAFANFAIPPFALQYKEILKEFGRYVKKHPNKKVIVTGHSLGGGLALSISVRYGVDAITFDASPRIFDGLGDKHAPAKRVLIYQSGEILQHVRGHWKKIFEVIPSKDIYSCSFNFDDISKRLGKKAKASEHPKLIKRLTDYKKLGLLRHAEDYVKLALQDHCSDCLAFGLLELGVSTNQQLVPIRSALPVNP